MTRAWYSSSVISPLIYSCLARTDSGVLRARRGRPGVQNAWQRLYDRSPMTISTERLLLGKISQLTGDNINTNGSSVLRSVLKTQECKLCSPADNSPENENPSLDWTIIGHRPKANQEKGLEGKHDSVRSQHHSVDVGPSAAKLHYTCTIAAWKGVIFRVHRS